MRRLAAHQVIDQGDGAPACRSFDMAGVFSCIVVCVCVGSNQISTRPPSDEYLFESLERVFEECAPQRCYRPGDLSTRHSAYRSSLSFFGLTSTDLQLG